jgi:Tfp pilus assembly protein PilN
MKAQFMRPLVNLSSQPFRNRRLFWLAILLLFVVPFYFCLDAIGAMARRQAELDALDAEIQKLQASFKTFEKPASANVTISADRNLQLVAASELIARRAFSWSQLLDDVERNLPAGVRVLSVAVAQIQPDERDDGAGGDENAATLNMTVIGKGNADVTTMITKFHDSRRFKVSPVSRKAVEGTEEIEFDLKVEYLAPTTAPRAGLGNQIAEKKQ